MPVEAIHISTYLDSLSASAAPARLRSGTLRDLGRLGAVVIDFPYFERFPLGVLRYLLHRPTAQSKWGEVLHKGSPVQAAERLLEQSRALRERDAQAADRVLALALGFVSHLAVDRSMHPLVNRMARERARRVGGDPSHHHTEVEKFHTVLFHEERFGFDIMGTRTLRDHIAVDAHAVHRDADLFAALNAAFADVVGQAPGTDNFARWARGYRQYVWLVSSPVGKRIVPSEVKKRVRGELYRGAFGAFVDAYGAAARASREALDAALAWALAPTERASQARMAFSDALPEGPIDLG